MNRLVAVQFLANYKYDGSYSVIYYHKAFLLARSGSGPGITLSERRRMTFANRLLINIAENRLWFLDELENIFNKRWSSYRTKS